MDGKLCPEIHPPPLAIFTPLFQGKPPPFNSEIFQTPPFLKFWLESQNPPPPFRKGGGGGCPLCFNDIKHGYRAAILKKNSLWLLPFYMAVATYLYHEKAQLYRTSLKEMSYELNIFVRSTAVESPCYNEITERQSHFRRYGK